MELERRSGQCQLSEMLHGVADVKTYIRINVEGCILHQSLGHVHHLGQDEYILKTVGDLLRNELDEVWNQLVETGVIP